MTIRNYLVLALLIFAACLGNYFRVSLFFGTDFLFGSTAVLVVLYYYGITYGMLAAVIAGSVSIFLWGHPYSLINLTSEALVVGLLLRKTRGNLLLLDGLFWLAAGIPINMLSFGVFLHMGITATSFIALKQAINGIFNALVASIIINHTPVHRLLGFPSAQKILSLKEVLFNTLLAFILLPSLLILVQDSREYAKTMETGAVADLDGMGSDLCSHFQMWYVNRLRSVEELARASKSDGVAVSAQLQHDLELIMRSSGNFLTFYVANAEGTTVAYSPAILENGKSMLGVNFADRSYFQKIRATKHSLLSGAFQGRGINIPIVALSVPILKDDQFIGLASGALDLKRIEELIAPYSAQLRSRRSITVTDSEGRVIASTIPYKLPLDYSRSAKYNTAHALSSSVYFYTPETAEKLPSVAKWKNSFYVLERRISDEIPWTVVIKLPVAPLQERLFLKESQIFLTAAGISILAFLLALGLSRWIVGPLAALTKITADLPCQLPNYHAPDWPGQSTLEVQALTSKFQSMSELLGRNFQELSERSARLSSLNEELEKEIRERKQAEDALRASEQSVRLKLESIISPEGDVGNLELCNIIDIQEIQLLLKDLYEFTNFPARIVDLKGEMLTGTGQQEICTRFHRAHPGSCKNCTETQSHISRDIAMGEFELYKCKNNLWEVATPIVIGGKHMGILFSGQFFFDDEPQDLELFRLQAKQYGFSEEEYMAAFEKVPRLSRRIVERGMAFLVKFAQVISQLSYSNIKLARTLSERSALMDAARENEKRLSMALAASDMGVWEWDLRSDQVSWSPECYKIMGVSSFGGTISSFMESIHPEDLCKAMIKIKEAVDNRAVYRNEFRIIQPDGTVRWVLRLGRAEFDENNEPFKMKGIIQDITERKLSEEEHRRVEAQLQQAQKMEALGTLAGGIAHDFNNILGIIMGYTDMAKSDIDEESPIQENLSRVLRASSRAKELVKQILAFSRRSEQQKIILQPGTIIKEAMRILRPTLPSTIEIRNEVYSKAAVMADPTQIHQILMNLCTNAAHAMQDKGGVLEVSLRDVVVGAQTVSASQGLQPGPYVELTVKDSGQGIDPSIMDSIFDPFFTTKGLGEGTGLGLSVVHGIVKSHGGIIKVESTPGIGTSFIVLIPAHEDGLSPEVIETAERASIPCGQERVLVVDDEPLLADIAKQMLSRQGYDVVSCTNGTEALETFKNQLSEKRFDLVVTDMTMPHLTGLDLAKELTRIDPAVPVLILTGYSKKIDAGKIEEIGIREFLMKPLNRDQLAKRVRAVLDECKR